MTPQGVAFRPWHEGDHAYVLSTWMRSHRDASPRSLRSKHAMAGYRRQVEQQLNDCGALVACDAELPTTIHGWACGTEGLLHYVYVPRELRCLGVGRELISRVVGGYPDRIEVTHRWPWPSGRFVLRIERSAA